MLWLPVTMAFLSGQSLTGTWPELPVPPSPGAWDSLLDLGASLLGGSESAPRICEMDPLASKLGPGNWEGPG